MLRIAWLNRKIHLIVPTIMLILIVIIWFNYYSMGFHQFNKQNAVSILGSVIQGMSALLSVAIAVIVFRIQSLENRNQMLEESTLNYIFQTARLTYPKWIPSVEEDIRSGALTHRYYIYRFDTLNRTIGLSETDREKVVKDIETDRDAQQKRLEETLNLHTRIDQTVQRIRNGIFSSVVFLMMPILFSFLLLMVSDTLDVSYNFVFVSVVVLMSAIGIALLTRIVLESTVQN